MNTKNVSGIQLKVFWIVLFLAVIGTAMYSQDQLPNNDTTNVRSKKYGGYITSKCGYDIYYDLASVKLSRVEDNSGGHNLKVAFQIPPYYDWGNWFSIRKVFANPVNLSGYNGVELKIRVLMATSDACLRLTIVDKDKKYPKMGDELWWYDFSASLLKNKSPEWISLKIPFSDLDLSYGIGARVNNHTLDLNNIWGYEYNFISVKEKNAQGVVLIKDLKTYK